MFCTKCGAEIAEGSKFCIRCGTPVVNGGAHAKVERSPANPSSAVLQPDTALTADAPAAGPSPEIYVGNTAATPRKRDTKKLFPLGAAALVIIIAVVLVFFRGPKTGFDSPEEAFDAYNNGIYNHDLDQVLQASPDFLIAYNGGEDSMKANLEASYSDIYAAPEGAFYFVYRAIGHTSLSEEARETLRSNINAALNTDVKITDAAEIAYECKAKYRDDGHEVPVTSSTGGTVFAGGYAIQCKGKWYYYMAY